MAVETKFRRGTTAEHASFTGALAEVTVDTTKDSLVVHDGVTAVGHPIATSADLTTVENTIQPTADASAIVFAIALG